MVDYPYESQLIADPVTFQRAVRASISVYDIDDATNSTLLPLKDLNGLPLANPLTSSADAFVPPFIAQEDGVKLVGAGLTVPAFSPQGIRNAAEASAVAAQDAANAAADAAGATISTATVNGSGRLILTKANAATVDAGSVIGPQGPTGAKGADGANVLPTDTAVKDAIENPASATRGALNATYASKDVVLNAKDYGVLGNGTNEGAAINAFLALAAGKRAYFPPGNYVSDQSLLPKTNTTVFGAGRGVTVFTMLGNDTNQNIRVSIFGQDNVTLRDFTVTETNVLRRIGNYGLVSGEGLKRCLIENIETTISSGTGMHFIGADELIVKGCYIHHTKADGLHIQRGSRNVVVSDNIINNNGDDAIGFVSHAQSTAGYCENIVITGNILGPTGVGEIGSGIALIGCLGATVVGNTVRGAASAGIRITSIDERPKNAGFAIVGNILVEGNRIIECGWYSGAIPGQTRDGVAMYNTRNVTIRGNVIDKPKSNGITISQCSIDAVIESNDIRRTGESGIFVAQAEQVGDYLSMWTHPEVDDGRNKTYVAHHNMTIAGNRINSSGLSGIIAQGSAARYIDGLAAYRNKIRFTNTTAAASQYGMNTSYIDGLDLTQNDVGDAAAGATITRYNKANIINAMVSGNVPLTSTTGQVTFMGQNQHTSGAVDPTSGTWELGQAVWNGNPQTGAAPYKVAAISGTMGTLNGGATTGSITSGSALLTVSSVSGLGSGGYITVAGVTGKKKIIGIAGSVLTLDTVADATVTGAAVAFSAASFRTPGNLA